VAATGRILPLAIPLKSRHNLAVGIRAPGTPMKMNINNTVPVTNALFVDSDPVAVFSFAVPVSVGIIS
jgi:hypothetical protein